MSDLGSCVRLNCTWRAVRTLGSEALCHDHCERILEPIRERVLARESLDGVGRLDGELTPEYGPGTGLLRCSQCRASWAGAIGMPCPWCARSLELAQKYQAEILLGGCTIDRDDARYFDAVEAWGGRLTRAVQSGLVERRAADIVWARTVAHVRTA